MFEIGHASVNGQILLEMLDFQQYSNSFSAIERRLIVIGIQISHRDQTRCLQVSTVLAWWRGTLGSGQAPRDREHEMLLAV